MVLSLRVSVLSIIYNSICILIATRKKKKKLKRARVVITAVEIMIAVNTCWL